MSKRHYIYFTICLFALFFALFFEFSVVLPIISISRQNAINLTNKTESYIRQANKEREQKYEFNPLLLDKIVTSTLEVRAIYLTASTATNPKRLEELIAFVKRTKINAMVINTKDGGEQLSDKMLAAVLRLKEEGIEPIARIVVFKDTVFLKKNPQDALKYAGGGFWRDNTGSLWVDPAARDYWAYLVDFARRSVEAGFEEINLDYVRFPTDGTLTSIRYPAWDGKTPKTDVITSFFKYFNEELAKTYPDVPVSLDIFGYTFISSGGLNIGQKVEEASKYFDYIAPMVYPSHYGPGNFGFENPAAHPFAVIKGTLDKGYAKLPANFPKNRVRPWLQAFNMGGYYGVKEMSEQIRALSEFGTDEYYLWNASNSYERFEQALK